MSALEKTRPLIRVSIICIGSIGQLNLVSSIIVYNWGVSWTILGDSPFLSIITGLINVFPVVRESLFTVAIIAKYVRISNKCCTLSCKSRGIRVACWFLNSAVAFKIRFVSTLILPTSKLETA